MSEPRSREEFLQDIADWGERVRSYVENRTYSDFVSDRMFQDAVIRCLEIMGEASGNVLRLDPTIVERHPTVPFQGAYRARNRTAHGYGSVNLETVWTSATVSAPALVAKVKEILSPQD